ncbi:Uncharacterised protein [Shigella sonnei]|nr:Uncharacterised protein [Shigella sonnei]
MDTDAIRSFFLIIIVSRCRRVWLKAETVQRHTRWDQIINRQIKSHDRCQMSRLVERGTQGKVMTVLPGQAAHVRKTFAFIEGVGLLQHFCTT